jgi:hypothetical protein
VATGQPEYNMKTGRKQVWSSTRDNRDQHHVLPALTLLKEQCAIDYMNINAIYTKIKNQRPDLRVCLPVLSQKVHDILDEQSNVIQSKSYKLGSQHPFVQHLGERLERLIDDANRALHLCNTTLHHLDDPSYRYLCTDINNPQPAEDTTDNLGTQTPMGSIATVEADVPVTVQMITRLLKQQRLEILEVLETVIDNISQQRADLLACIPELRNIMCELMEDHLGNVQLLATKLGKSHNVAREMVEQHLQLEEAVNGTLRQVNETVMDSKEDWKEYRNACTDHEVPSEKDLSLGPDTECSSPPRSAAAQAVQCTSATKAEPNTRKKEMQGADNLSLGPDAPDSKYSSSPETAAAQCTSATKAVRGYRPIHG